jgi:broad specificity phosphatase PhoE
MKPKRIFLIRHGESAGNANKEIYETTPDYAVRLTERGREQVTDAGHKIVSLMDGKYAALYYSPFIRTIETANGILSSLKAAGLVERRFVKEDARLREQEWHSCLPLSAHDIQREKDRIKFGVFFYRFPHGESNADVYDRMGSFTENLYRDFQRDDFPENLILVTHGMAMRVLLMNLLNKTVDDFDTWVNPWNCAIWKMELVGDDYTFDFDQIKKRKIEHNYRMKLIDL